MRHLFAIAAMVVLPATALAQEGDAEAGETVFRKCQACHQVGEDAKDRVGPVLNDIFGAQAGTREGFRYSDAMIEAGEEGLIWTAETLAEFLEKPRDYIKRTKMSFAGLRDEEDRADVIAYLAQFSDPEAVAEHGQGDGEG